MIETTLICDKCAKQKNLESYTQFSNMDVIGEGLLGDWSADRGDGKYMVLCKKCSSDWKSAKKDVITKKKKEFFKK